MMALLLALLLQYIPSGPSFATGGAPTVHFVNGCIGSASAVSANCSLSITNGDLLIVHSKSGNTSGTATPAFSGVAGCTWKQAVPPTPFVLGVIPFDTSIYTCIAQSSGSDTVTVTWSGNQGTLFTDIEVAQYSSTATWPDPVFDTYAYSNNTTASSSCATGTTASTAHPNELLIAVCDSWNSGQTWNAVTGWTNQAAASRNTAGFYSKVVSSTGTQSVSLPFSSADISTGEIVALRIN